jgi:hypothetical protein
MALTTAESSTRTDTRVKACASKVWADWPAVIVSGTDETGGSVVVVVGLAAGAVVDGPPDPDASAPDGQAANSARSPVAPTRTTRRQLP